MPGFYAHYLNAEAAYDKLPESPLKKFISEHRAIYDLGAQGPDPFYFYDLNDKNREEITRFYEMLHDRQVDEYMSTLHRYIIPRDPKDKEILVAFFLGFMTHYALDGALHPYLYYRTGFSRQGDNADYNFRYKRYHRRFETELDVLLLKEIKNATPKQFPIDKKFWIEYTELTEISRMYSYLIIHTFGKECDRKVVERSYQNTNDFMKLAVKGGLGALPYRSYEVTHNDAGAFTLMLYPETVDDTQIDRMNKKNNKWVLPWDERVARTESVMQLFNAGVDNSIRLMQAVFEGQYGTATDVQVLAAIGANSLSSGVRWNNAMLWRYYDIAYKEEEAKYQKVIESKRKKKEENE